MKKVFVVGHGIGYSRWINDMKLVNNIEDADVVVFTGGEDVDPSVYNKKKHDSVWSDLSRDEYEIAAFKKMKPNQLAVGICRGLQLLNCLHGGILCQDVDNHWISGTHEIHNRDFKYEIKSLHHQMVYPYDLDPANYDVLYWTSPRSGRYEGDGIDPNNYLLYGEPEVVVYKTPGLPKALGIQGHPEMMREDAPVVGMLNNLIDQLLSNNNE